MRALYPLLCGPSLQCSVLYSRAEGGLLWDVPPFEKLPKILQVFLSRPEIDFPQKKITGLDDLFVHELPFSHRMMIDFAHPAASIPVREQWVDAQKYRQKQFLAQASAPEKKLIGLRGDTKQLQGFRCPPATRGPTALAPSHTAVRAVQLSFAHTVSEVCPRRSVVEGAAPVTGWSASEVPPEVQATLSTAVQFFLVTSTIPRIGNRIECWLVRDGFDATVPDRCIAGGRYRTAPASAARLPAMGPRF